MRVRGTYQVSSPSSGRVAAAVGLLAVAVLGAEMTVGSAAAAAVATPSCSATSASCTVTFGFTGASQSFVVPPGVTSLTATVIGAGGAQGSSGSFSEGAQVAGILTGLTPGQTLYVEVGGTPTGDTSEDCFSGPCI